MHIGYANPDVNNAVMNAIKRGSMCTLNSYEEVQLAEKLIELHPFTEMVRFSRTGGEACSIAVRIGRAASGKSKVAVCGYHGWHDWYLAANIGDSNNLKDLLLPGLNTFESSYCDSNFHLYVLLINFGQIGRSRAQFMYELKNRNIQTQVHYIPVHLRPFYQKKL